MVFLLAKIMEILTEKDSLTIPEIQNNLKIKYGVVVPQRRIVAVIEKNGDKLDVMCKGDKTTVVITTKYRELLERHDENIPKD